MRLVLVALFSLLAVATARDMYFRYPFLEGRMCHSYAYHSYGEVYYREHRASSSYFKLACPAQDYRACEWYHEEWKIPRFYMRDTSIDDRGYLRMRAHPDNCGTWRVRYGGRETIYHVTVMPDKYEDFHEEFALMDDNNERYYSYDYRRFEDRDFENMYFYNRMVKHSYFKNVRFNNMHFHYVRFENVTFEDVSFEWSKEWYMRAEFINCRFINTMWLRPRFMHSYFHRCRFEGGMRYDFAEERYRDYFHTFVDFYFYDTMFCDCDWYDAFWYRGEAYNCTFNHNMFYRFEMFETRFYSYYRMMVSCRDIMFGDYVEDFRYFDEDHCYAYVYRRGADMEYNYDDMHFDLDYYYSWRPSMRFYNCRFDYFRFRRHQFRAVEWFSTYFYNGTFYGEDYGYFHDMHFARCRFYYTDFYKFHFRGFMYFTGCHFDRFNFYETHGDRFYFYGCYFYYMNMHFMASRYMYFDYCYWEHGYMRGRYDFFRFEHTMYRYFSWEADRVDRFEYCHLYYDQCKFGDANIGTYRSMCNDEHYRYMERYYRFCYDYPYHYRCMHYRPYYRFYYCYDEGRMCNYRTYTWWYHWDFHYPRHYDQSFMDFERYDGYFMFRNMDKDMDTYYHRHYDMSFYEKYYEYFMFDTRYCYRRMDKFYDEPALMMRESYFYRSSGSFLGMDYMYRHCYDGKCGYDYYFKCGHAYDRRFYWFERFFRCFHY